MSTDEQQSYTSEELIEKWTSEAPMALARYTYLAVHPDDIMTVVRYIRELEAKVQE